MSFVEHEDPEEILAAVRDHLLSQPDVPEDLIEHLNDDNEFDIIKTDGEYMVAWYSHAHVKHHSLIMDPDMDNEELEGQLYWLSEHHELIHAGPDDEDEDGGEEREHEDI
jgi:hypothetical protein